MELYTYCYQCSSEFGEIQRAIAEVTDAGDDKEQIILPKSCRVYFPITDSNVYHLTCNKGHEFYYIYPELKFESLFRSSVNSYANSYFRDAVSSAAVSLERFYEFCIKAMCLEKGIDIATFEKSWKDVDNQSERQLGAFLFLYLITVKEVSPTLKNDLIKLRNGVTHKGKYPSKEDTFKYLDSVLKIQHLILETLNKHISSSISLLHRQPNDVVKEYTNKGLFVRTESSIGIISAVIDGHKFDDLNDKIRIVNNNKVNEEELMKSIIAREINRKNKQISRPSGNGLLIRIKAKDQNKLDLYIRAVDELYGPIGTHYFSMNDASLGFGTPEFVPDQIFINLATSLDIEIGNIFR